MKKNNSYGFNALIDSLFDASGSEGNTSLEGTVSVTSSSTTGQGNQSVNDGDKVQKESAGQAFMRQEFPSALQADEEYRQIEERMSSPDVASQPAVMKKLGRRRAELTSIVELTHRLTRIVDDYYAAKELAQKDPLFEEEVTLLETEMGEVQNELRTALIPRDPDDTKDVIMEIKAGSGGEEAALFASDLVRMYTRYAQNRHWKVDIQSNTSTPLGGTKDIQIAFRAPSVEDPSQGVWANLKYEGGVHRVQRVPVTESQGRIQTSSAGVIVYPEADDDDEEIVIDPKDIRVDTFQASGPGGQGVNTTYSAVRITHLPTGIAISMQDERSQIQNRANAMRVLKSRLLAMKREEEEKQAANMRHSQVRSLDRSERIRTYNFPENRIADHRTGYKAHNLDQVLEGDLQSVIDSSIEADEKSRLEANSR